MALLLWLANRGITFVVLLLFVCLLPQEPIEHPANEMAMAGAGVGAGLALLLGYGIAWDFICSLPGLVLLPLLIGKILGIPNASHRRRTFYCTIGGLQMLMQVLASYAFLKGELVDLEKIEALCLLVGLHLVAGLGMAKIFYKYWLADAYYWSE